MRSENGEQNEHSDRSGHEHQLEPEKWDENRLSDADRRAEAALSALRPLRPRRSADAIPVLAATAALRAGRRQVWAWRGVAAALAAGLILSLLSRPQPRIEDRIIVKVVEREQQPTRWSPPAAGPEPTQADRGAPNSAAHNRSPLPVLLDGEEYAAVRSRVLALGVRAINVTPAGAFSAAGSAASRVPPVRAMGMPDVEGASPAAPALLNWMGPLFRGGRS